MAIIFFLFYLAYSACADRLFLSDGGYARVISLQEYPLSSFTLSGWINVTSFSEGITPILTYLSHDVNSQVSFFIRPDGVGVLWGGPSPSLGVSPTLDRQPRLIPIGQESKTRSRRDAKDYRQGLGDVENILSKRSGNVGNSWSPLNFVDVGEMGVDDLMFSGSESHPIIAQNKEPRSHEYSQWTNVPYELNMEESGTDNNYAFGEEVADIAPSIITKPSGQDDFVYFNWNVPSEKSRNIPLGNNNWSPVWESTRNNPQLNQESQSLQPKQTLTATPSVFHHQAWDAHPQPQDGVDFSNKWDPVNSAAHGNGNVYELTNLNTKLLPTNIERPIWPSSPKVPKIKTGIPPRTKLPQNTDSVYQHSKVQLETKPFTLNAIPSNAPGIIKLNGVQIKETQRPPIQTPASILATKQIRTRPPTTTVTHPRTTTTPIPRRSVMPPRRNAFPNLYRYKEKKKDGIPTNKHQENNASFLSQIQNLKRKQTSGRIPLWKLIKNPSDDSKHTTIQTITSPRPTTQVPKIKKQNIPLITFPVRSKTSVYTTTKPSYPIPTLPSIKTSKTKDKLQSSGSHRRNIFHRSRPVQIPSIARRTPAVFTTTTESPTTTKEIPIQTTTTMKVPNYQSSNSASSKTREYENRSVSNRDRYKIKTNEFEKAMQYPELINEGNTAVVYAVPITNEKEFYKMYKKYQRDALKPNESKMNLHKLYHEMRIGNIDNDSEKETSENGIKSQEELLYNTNYGPSSKQTDISQVKAEENLQSQASYETPETQTPPKRPITNTLIWETSSTENPPQFSSTPERTITQPITQIPTQNIASTFEPQSDKTAPNPETINVIEEPEVINADSKDVYDEYHFYEDTEKPLDAQYYEYYDDEHIGEDSNLKYNYELPDQIAEESVDYYTPKKEVNAILADNYKPENIISPVNPSNYQETQQLYQQQLPPQYLNIGNQNFEETNEDDGAIHRKAENLPIPQAQSNTMFNSNPLSFLPPDSIPQPIHAVDTQEETNVWTRGQNENDVPSNIQPQIPIQPQNILDGSEDQKHSSVVISAHSLPSPLINSHKPMQPLPELTKGEETLSSNKLPLNIHFEKVTYPFSENRWYHLAFTWNTLTKRVTIYVNGEPIGLIDNFLQEKRNLERGGLFLLGKTLLPDLSDFDESSQFHGEMSDVNLWATELPSYSVDSLFQCKYDPASPQPVDWGTTQLKLYDQATMNSSPPLCGLVT